jgi:hypothetical protein
MNHFYSFVSTNIFKLHVFKISAYIDPKSFFQRYIEFTAEILKNSYFTLKSLELPTFDLMKNVEFPNLQNLHVSIFDLDISSFEKQFENLLQIAEDIKLIQILHLHQAKNSQKISKYIIKNHLKHCILGKSCSREDRENGINVSNFIPVKIAYVHDLYSLDHIKLKNQIEFLVIIFDAYPPEEEGCVCYDLYGEITLGDHWDRFVRNLFQNFSNLKGIAFQDCAGEAILNPENYFANAFLFNMRESQCWRARLQNLESLNLEILNRKTIFTKELELSKNIPWRFNFIM